jgi:hypothetical protein
MYARRHEMHITNFLKIGAGVLAILVFFLSNLNGCHVGITDEYGFLYTPLKLAQVA